MFYIFLFDFIEDLKRKINGVPKVRAIVLDHIGVDCILLDPAIREIFYFKHHAGASLLKIFLGNPDFQCSSLVIEAFINLHRLKDLCGLA